MNLMPSVATSRRPDGDSGDGKPRARISTDGRPSPRHAPTSLHAPTDPAAPSGNRLLKRDARVRRHLRVAALAAGPLAVVVAVQGFALAALVVAAAQHGRFDRIAAALLVSAAVVRGLAGWRLERSGRRAAAAAIGTLREQLVRDAATLAVLSPGALRPGEVTADVVAHLPAIEAYVGRFLSARPTAAATTVVVLAAVFLTDHLSALLLAPTVPLLVVFLWLVGSQAQAAADARLASLELLGAHLLDVLRGLTDLRAFGRSAHQREQVELVAANYRTQTMATLRAAFLSGLVLELVAMLGTALVAVFGGVRLAGGSATLAAILPALVLAPELYAPLRRMGAGYHDAADARAALDRLATVSALAADAPTPGRPGGAAAPRPSGQAIVLEGVTVRDEAAAGGASGAGAANALVTSAAEGRAERVSNVSLTLVPGLTALVGPSGSGKSTIGHLVLGLLRPTAGRMLVGDIDLGERDLDRWRERCAWVAQDPVLLAATLRDNVRLARPDAADDVVIDALVDAGLGPLTAALPRGLDCLLGEGAARLSTGELRRLAMARAIIADADLIVFDEPTAGLDALTAQRLRGTMLAVATGRTALLITHDPKLASCADEIIELSGGRVFDVRDGCSGGGTACTTCKHRGAGASTSEAIVQAGAHLGSDQGDVVDQNDTRIPNTGAIAAQTMVRAANDGTTRTSAPTSLPIRPSAALRLFLAQADGAVRRKLAVAIGYGALSAISAVAVLALSGGLIDDAALRPPVLELTMVIVLVRTFSIVRATTRYGERLASHDAALRLLEGLRVQVFARFTTAVPGSTDDRSTSALDEAVSDVDRAADLLICVLVPAASSIAAMVAGIGAAAWFDARAAAALAVAALVLGAVVWATATRAGRALAAAEPARADLTARITMALDAGPELLLAGRTAQQVDEVAQIARPLETATAQHSTRTAALAGIVGSGAALTAVAVASLTSGQHAAGDLTGPIAAALILGSLACIERLDGVSDAGLALPAAATAAKRLLPALAFWCTPATPADSDKPRGSDQPSGADVYARHLTLTRGPRTIICGASLALNANERIALTGESGAGKSTLLLALAGLLPPSQGHITIAGHALDELTETERAALVLLVPSTPHLFGGTLAANLRIASPNASDKQLTAALSAVGLGEWLNTLPAQLETQLGEHGVRASGGERQKIGLARAALSPAPIVLLDEPASHLPEPDALTALTAVIDARPGRATLLVSHRTSERNLTTREVRLETGGGLVVTKPTTPSSKPNTTPRRGPSKM